MKTETNIAVIPNKYQISRSSYYNYNLNDNNNSNNNRNNNSSNNRNNNTQGSRPTISNFLPRDKDLLAAARMQFSRPPLENQRGIRFQRGETLNPYPVLHGFNRRPHIKKTDIFFLPPYKRKATEVQAPLLEEALFGLFVFSSNLTNSSEADHDEPATDENGSIG
ncbi:ras-related protein RabX-like [Topomyia yanbarensis]|uniref:ras-related protein RabX-like n=1 Tax=Topomyia yanbarensis TaxID=2498891 RepID=UPI00273BD011|nr:ras-related protein RabX-like [Topomyia yanbarensis]